MAASKCPTEHQETVAVVQWFEMYRRAMGLPRRALFHIPNEGKRSFSVSARLGAEGMRTGTPDLMLAVMRGGHGGLFIEMKRAKGGRLSDAQREALAEYEDLGYAVKVAHGADEAIDAIKEYLCQDEAGTGLMRFLSL